MDTESSILYQKACLEYYFDKPVQVRDWFLQFSYIVTFKKETKEENNLLWIVHSKLCGEGIMK